MSVFEEVCFRDWVEENKLNLSKPDYDMVFKLRKERRKDMKEIHLQVSELQDILKFVEDVGAKNLTIEYQTSGIGSIIKVTVQSNLNGHTGSFTKTITDESSW